MNLITKERFYPFNQTSRANQPSLQAISKLKTSGKKIINTILNPQKIDVTFQKFTKPTTKTSKTIFPTSQQDLKNIRFHFDLSNHTHQIPDNRPNTKPDTTQTSNIIK